MLTSLALAAYLAAPSAPPPAPPVVAAPVPAVRPAITPAHVPTAAPRVLDLKPENGKVLVPVVRAVKEKIQIQMGNAIGAPNGAPPRVIERETTVTKETKVELSEVKDLTVTTADGKAVDTKDALKRLAEGGQVVVTSNGKPVDPKFLKVLRDDTLVLVSPELVVGPAGGMGWGHGGVIVIDQAMPGVAPVPGVVRPIVKPLPAPLPAEKP